MGIDAGSVAGPQDVRECFLCKIVAGEIRVVKLIETERVIGFINDIRPASTGHCVFFPKRHAPSLQDTDDRDLQDLVVAIKRVAQAAVLQEYNVLQNNGSLAGQTVFHAHFHLVPKWSAADGLKVDHGSSAGIDHSEFVQKIKGNLSVLS